MTGGHVLQIFALAWPVSFDQTIASGRSSRTSCAQRHATAILAAHSSASSRECTSTTANPPMTSLVSGYGPSVTVPSVATTLALWLSSPPPKTHTPASWAAWTTSCAALATSGRSSSGKVIAPSSNEIRYRVIGWLLVPATPPAASHPFYERLAPDPTGCRQKCSPDPRRSAPAGVIRTTATTGCAAHGAIAAPLSSSSCCRPPPEP